MSYPMGLEVSFGSEASFVGSSGGGGVTSSIITSGVDDVVDSEVKPVKGAVYCSNKVQCWKVVVEERPGIDPETGEEKLEKVYIRDQVKCYYVFDITDIEESEDKESLRKILKKLSVSIQESGSSGADYGMKDNFASVLESLGLSSDDWKLVDHNGVELVYGEDGFAPIGDKLIRIKTPINDEVLVSGFYMVGFLDPVTSEDLKNITWRKYVDSGDDDAPQDDDSVYDPLTESFTFKD